MKPIHLALLSVALAAVLAACGTTNPGQGTGQPAADTDADVTVTATDMAFEPGTVTVATAGQSFAVRFVNRDTMPHNIAIYSDAAKTEKLFEGEMVTDGSITYTVPALEAGEYFYDCSLHPNMTGRLVVEG